MYARDMIVPCTARSIRMNVKLFCFVLDRKNKSTNVIQLCTSQSIPTRVPRPKYPKGGQMMENGKSDRYLLRSTQKMTCPLSRASVIDTLNRMDNDIIATIFPIFFCSECPHQQISHYCTTLLSGYQLATTTCTGTPVATNSTSQSTPEQYLLRVAQQYCQYRQQPLANHISGSQSSIRSFKYSTCYVTNLA